MTDLSTTVAPKSNQLNSDDLISGPRTITVTKVSSTGSGDQPIAISFEGDNGRPFLPCKTVRRLLISVWGSDGAAYVGRSMTIYCDPSVEFGGIAVGGIRVSHMSHIDQPKTVSLTEKRSRRKPVTVKPLKIEKPKPAATVDDAAADEAASEGMSAYHAFVTSLTKDVQRAYVATEDHKRRKQIASDADDATMLNGSEAAE